MKRRRFDRINSVLPDDLMLEIFQYMESKQDREASSLVCTRWLNLVRLSRETIRIRFSDGTDDLIKLLSYRFFNVKHVYIDENPLISPAPIYGRPSLINEFPIIGVSNPVYEEMRKCCVSNSGLVATGGGFTKLESLSLIWCRGVTDVGLISFAQKCKLLKSLDLQDCCVGDKGLAAIAQYCTQLKDLNLEHCDGLTDTGFVHLTLGLGRTLKSLGLTADESLTDVSLEAVGFHCTSLETLSIQSEFISNKGLLSVVKGCSLLKSLKLHCKNITDEALQAVGSFCLLLEILAICDSKKLTDKSLSAIGKGCRKLKNLSLIYCYSLSVLGLDCIAVGCADLMRLEVDHCGKIGIAGLKSIGKACTYLSEFVVWPYGQELHFNEPCESDIGCKYLQSFRLINCTSFGDEALQGISRGCRNLKKLDISRCCEVGDEGIISVSQNCKFLTYLILTNCYRVGDAGIIAIAKACSQLSFLNVKCLKNLGDEGMAALGKSCPLLEDLEISRCEKITDVGLSYIAKNCKLLESCTMLKCYGISKHGITTLITDCPKIKKLSVEEFKYSPRTELGVGQISSRTELRSRTYLVRHLWHLFWALF